jgi:ABC-type multidrug transport system fused ATPase/permease subunit
MILDVLAHVRELIGVAFGLRNAQSYAWPQDKSQPLQGTTVPRLYSAGDTWAIKAVSLTISEGQMVGSIGRSGAGKSTLLRLINRLLDLSGVYALRG